MSENENDSSNSYGSFKDLDKLEAALTEPLVEKVLTKARAYNSIFKEAQPTDEERQQITGELDTDWDIMLNSKMYYTGYITVPKEDEAGEVQRVFLDGKEVLSNGFIVSTTPQYKDGEHVGEMSAVEYYMYVKREDAYGKVPQEGEKTHTPAQGDIDESTVEFTIASPERAIAWLEASCPDLLADIEERLFNSTESEFDPVLSLTSLDFGKHAALNDEFTRNCVETYLKQMIEIDMAVPYSVRLYGLARLATDESKIQMLDVEKALVHLHSIAIRKGITATEANPQWTLSAYLTPVSEDIKSGSSIFIVPISTMTSLQSMRKSFYGTSN